MLGLSIAATDYPEYTLISGGTGEFNPGQRARSYPNSNWYKAMFVAELFHVGSNLAHTSFDLLFHSVAQDKEASFGPIFVEYLRGIALWIVCGADHHLHIFKEPLLASHGSPIGGLRWMQAVEVGGCLLRLRAVKMLSIADGHPATIDLATSDEGAAVLVVVQVAPFSIWHPRCEEERRFVAGEEAVSFR